MTALFAGAESPKSLRSIRSQRPNLVMHKAPPPDFESFLVLYSSLSVFLQIKKSIGKVLTSTTSPKLVCKLCCALLAHRITYVALDLVWSSSIL